MVLPVVRQSTDAVVTVTQDLDSQLVVFLKGQGMCVLPVPSGHGAAAKQAKGRTSGGITEPGNDQAQLMQWVLTAASLSKRAKSSLSSFTSSWALQADDSWVKPTMSAKRMLQERGPQAMRLQTPT